MNDLSCGIRISAQLSFLLSESTRLSDGRTDSFLVAIPCVALHAVALYKTLRIAYDLQPEDILNNTIM